MLNKSFSIRNLFFWGIILVLNCSANAQGLTGIILSPPDTNRGLPVMKALQRRASTRQFDTTNLNQQDLSDLLWAANGINRPQSGKRTAPSALNAQDIDVYVVLKKGIYLYNAADHTLQPVVKGDHRQLFAGRNPEEQIAPVICLLVSDLSRFPTGDESMHMVWAAEDAGIVSQNISLFCASVGLATRPRANMPVEIVRQLLNLKKSQQPMLNQPVCYNPDRLHPD